MLQFIAELISILCSSNEYPAFGASDAEGAACVENDKPLQLDYG